MTEDQIRLAFENTYNFAFNRNITNGRYCSWVEDRWQGYKAGFKQASKLLVPDKLRAIGELIPHAG